MQIDFNIVKNIYNSIAIIFTRIIKKFHYKCNNIIKTMRSMHEAMGW